VPQANFNLRRLCTRYLNCEPLFIGEPNVIHGIKIKAWARAPTASAIRSARA